MLGLQVRGTAGPRTTSPGGGGTAGPPTSTSHTCSSKLRLKLRKIAYFEPNVRRRGGRVTLLHASLFYIL